MKLLIFFITVPLLFLNSLMAQNTINGKILNEQTKMPLAGVTVKVKNAASALTDSTGFFSITYAGSKPVLLLSCIGYYSLETKAGDNPNYFYLKPRIISMDEVTVSTGYQQLPKERSTGSFEQIDNKLLNRSVSPNILDRLEGITSGLYFSKVLGSSELFIRGLSTLQGNTAPLIILNNFPYDGDINNINPADVESITVLKDASAASIWGAQAGNGVIVITTKKGGYWQPVRLTLNSNITIQQRPDIYKDKSFINASDYISLEKYLFTQGQYDGDLSDVYSYPLVSPVVEILSRERDGTMSIAEGDAAIAALSKNDVRHDYEKYLYRSAVLQQYSIGLSGGSDKISYLLNAGLDRNQLSLTGNDTRRNNLYAVINLRPLPKMEISTSFTYTDMKNTYNGLSAIRPGGNKTNLYPYAKLADDSGHALAVVKDYRYGYIDTAGHGLLQDWHYRPLDEMKSQDHTILSQEVLLNLGISYKLNRSISLEVRGQYQKAYNENRDYYSPASYYARNLVNEYSNVAGDQVMLNIPAGGILDKTYASVEAWNLRGQLNYNAVFRKEQQVSLIAGAEVRENNLSSQAARVYGYNDDLLTFSEVDYITNFNLFDNLGSGTIPGNTSFSGILNRYLSVFGNGAYIYKNKYTLSVSVRKDASNLFGVNTNHKWNPFWSAGLAWKISDEPFYSVNWLPMLKARVTYGYSGNINNGLSALSIIRYSSSSPITGLTYALTTQPSNPDLRWERTGTTNYGLDFATKNNRLNGSAEYYVKKSSDLLEPVPVDPTIGSPAPLLTRNAANLSTKGIDIKLNSTLKVFGLRWETQLLFSYVRSKVTKYLFQYTTKNAYVGTGYTILPREGSDPFELISYRWAGLDPANGDPVGYIDGKTSKDYYNIVHPSSFKDLIENGTSRPPYFSSLRNSFYYKGWGLSANIIYKWGYYFRRSALEYDALFNNWIMNSEYSHRWQKPGDEKTTNVPSLSYPSDANRDIFYANSEATVERGDNIRVQDIRVSYDLQPKLNTKVVKAAQLYVYLNNVGILWRANHAGIDPDYGMGLPAPLSTSVGIQINF